MLTDANDVPRGSSIACDVCIVGAGAAGITIARDLVGSGRSVCVLESGGLEPDPAVQSPYRGTIEPGYLPRDHGYLTSTRLRYRSLGDFPLRQLGRRGAALR